MYIYTYIHICICTHTHIYIYIYTYVYSHMYIHIYLYIHIYMHVSISILYIYICYIHTYVYTYIPRYIHISSSSSCRAARSDIPDPLSPLLPIVHRLQWVFGATSVSSYSCCKYVRVGRPAFTRPYVRVHKSTSLMSSSLLLQLCHACLVCLTWIVFVMGGMWPYSWCLVGCCHLDLFKIAHSILV